MKHLLIALSILWIAPGVGLAQARPVSAILKRFEDFRPSTEQLAMYRLDWVASLAHAKTRARQEQRPILLVVIHAQYGDIHSGHC